MKSNFTNENFERFLRQNTDGLRMRPSAKVWKNISSYLNRGRRKIGFIVGVSLLLTSALGSYLMYEPANDSNFATNAAQKNGNGVTPYTVQNPNTSSSTAVITHNNKNQNASSRYSVALNTNRIQKTGVKTNQNTVNSNNDDLLHLNAEAKPGFSFTPTVVDSYFENETNGTRGSELKKVNAVDPLTIESVINSYQQKKSKVGLQVYFTPTASYRRLSDNNIDYITPSKPNFGFEVGMTAKYPIAKNIKARAGLQFNVNRYEIKTNYSYTELATIRLNDRNGVDLVQTSTNFNNFSGYRASWLENFYFQVSTPIGVEIKLTGNDKTHFGIASTVQPTYLLGDRAYLISSDYKNYAKVPNLVRRWNVNTNLETFVTYSTGKLNWQVGPQVRYQLLSSYLKKYPVKENLFDFGFKVGISLNNQ